MKVELNIPDADWARLVGVAEQQGVRIPQLILAATLELMPWKDTLASRVEHLVRAGLQDAVIAERLRIPNWRVATLRREAHLPANPFHRGEGRQIERKTA